MKESSRFWRHGFYYLMGALLILNLSFVVYSWSARKDDDIAILTNDELIEALTGNEIETVTFHKETDTIDGEFKASFREKWKNRRFTYTGKLSSGLYEQIIDKNLSTNPNLGAAAGFDKNAEFDLAIGLEDFASGVLKSTTFRPGERQVLSLKFMGIEAGELAIETSSVKKLNGTPVAEFTIRAKSRPGFKIFTLNDVATTYMDLETFRPLAGKILFEESKRYGSLFVLYDWKSRRATQWENYVESRGGRKKSKEEFAITDGVQTPFSALFHLRAQRYALGERQRFVIQEKLKNIEVRLNPLRKEDIATALGFRKALVLEMEIIDPGKNAEPSRALVWLSDDERQFILRLQLELQVGKITAEIKELNDRRAI